MLICLFFVLSRTKVYQFKKIQKYKKLTRKLRTFTDKVYYEILSLLGFKEATKRTFLLPLKNIIDNRCDIPCCRARKVSAISYDLLVCLLGMIVSALPIQSWSYKVGPSFLQLSFLAYNSKTSTIFPQLRRHKNWYYLQINMSWMKSCLGKGKRRKKTSFHRKNVFRNFKLPPTGY